MATYDSLVATYDSLVATYDSLVATYYSELIEIPVSCEILLNNFVYRGKIGSFLLSSKFLSIFLKFFVQRRITFKISSYICAQYAQCWDRVTKTDMKILRYNRLKIVLAEKERTGTWLSEQMGHSISTVSRWMTNRSALGDACLSKKVQPSMEQLNEITNHHDVDVKELLISSK